MIWKFNTSRRLFSSLRTFVPVEFSVCRSTTLAPVQKATANSAMSLTSAGRFSVKVTFCILVFKAQIIAPRSGRSKGIACLVVTPARSCSAVVKARYLATRELRIGCPRGSRGIQSLLRPRSSLSSLMGLKMQGLSKELQAKRSVQSGTLVGSADPLSLNDEYEAACIFVVCRL